MDSREVVDEVVDKVVDDQDIQRWMEWVKETLLSPLHVDIDQWFCYLCNNLPFSCASDLRRHVISEHNQLHSDFMRHKHRLPKGSPAFCCPICGARWEDICLEVAHTMIHFRFCAAQKEKTRELACALAALP